MKSAAHPTSTPALPAPAAFSASLGTLPDLASCQQHSQQRSAQQAVPGSSEAQGAALPPAAAPHPAAAAADTGGAHLHPELPPSPGRPHPSAPAQARVTPKAGSFHAAASPPPGSAAGVRGAVAQVSAPAATQEAKGGVAGRAGGARPGVSGQQQGTAEQQAGQHTPRLTRPALRRAPPEAASAAPSLAAEDGEWLALLARNLPPPTALMGGCTLVGRYPCLDGWVPHGSFMLQRGWCWWFRVAMPHAASLASSPTPGS
ncbi:hypothetical protein V8C86DRAFT_110676 [Haematococcus lacustris]